MRKSRTTLILLLSLYALMTNAQGNLLITPTRVVFEDNKNREDLNITNIGNDSAVYMVSLVHYKMLPNGGFQQIDDQSLSTPWADDFLRIFPRRVKLGPKESQTIRMQFRKLSGMTDGEYRSHLYFRAEKEVSPLGMNDDKADSTQMAVKITPIFGISIPVIVRTGELNYSNTLSDVTYTAINDSTAQVTVAIGRNGSASCYGDLKIDYTSEAVTTTTVGLAKGIAVYTDLDKRYFKLAIRLTEGKVFSKGKLDITFSNSTGDKNELAKITHNL